MKQEGSRVVDIDGITFHKNRKQSVMLACSVHHFHFPTCPHLDGLLHEANQGKKAKQIPGVFSSTLYHYLAAVRNVSDQGAFGVFI